MQQLPNDSDLAFDSDQAAQPGNMQTFTDEAHSGLVNASSIGGGDNQDDDEEDPFSLA